MENKEKPIKTYVEILRNDLTQLFAFFEQGLNDNKMVYEFWDAKDVLGHLTFWHESFARNISDLGQGIKPNPLTGKLSEVNKQSVETTTHESTENLIQRMKHAQNTIEAFIFEDTIDKIPYKKGSLDYSKIEHLEIVSNHIRKHLKDIRKTYGQTKK